MSWADRALYRAKQGGRNRVALADDSKGERPKTAASASASRAGRGLAPAEELESEHEAEAAPGEEHHDPARLRDEGRAFERDGAQRVVERGQRQQPQRRLDRLREALDREEDARAHEHRHHHDVHQPAHGLDLAGPAGHRQPQAGEAQGAEQADRHHRRDRPPHGDAERQATEGQQEPHLEEA